MGLIQGGCLFEGGLIQGFMVLMYSFLLEVLFLKNPTDIFLFVDDM